MDNSIQNKQRSEKIYNSKIRNHLISIQDQSPIPKIDPLSRKVAELLTQQELEILGIECFEVPAKKPFYTLPPSDPSNKHAVHIAQDREFCTPQKNSSSKVTISNLSPIVQNDQELKEEASEKPEEITKEAQEPLKPNTEQPESLAKDQVEEIINNLECIRQFKEDLQKEYPELILVSGEASSLNTNELKDAEEHKDLSEKSKCLKFEQFKVPQESIQEVNEKSLHGPSEITKSQFKEKSLSMHSKTKSCGFDSLTGPLQNSYTKASLLHSAQETVPKEIPRCHLNLSTLEASPIYFNVRVSRESKMKTAHGVGPADSLRKFLLKDPEAEEIRRKEIYERTMLWKREKKQKHEERKSDLVNQTMRECTFDPFYEKTLKKNKKERTFIVKSLSQSNIVLDDEYQVTKPTCTIQYTGLSPFDSTLGYSKGCNGERFWNKAKPMLNYKQVNLLN